MHEDFLLDTDSVGPIGRKMNTFVLRFFDLLPDAGWDKQFWIRVMARRFTSSRQGVQYQWG